MRYHRLFFLLLFCFLGVKTFADVFVVTSNADSGPGTLRDALTQAAANGSTVKDYINFNIADQSVAGRTITIKNTLPDVSSNLIIDGTTQPGSNFGVSAAKVRVVLSYWTNTVPQIFCLSIFNQHDVELYGLMLDKDPSFFGSYGSFTVGLFIQNSQNITIGAPGKGNVFKNFENDIGGNDFYRPTQATVSNHVKISANFIGINEDGTSVCALGSASIKLGAIENFTLGGNTAAEGNVCYGTGITVKGGDNTPLDLGTTLISHNIFGLNYLGTAALTNGTSNTNGFSVADYYNSFKNIEITDNISLGEFQISPTGSFFKIQGNKIGTDITGKIIIPHLSFGVVLGYCTGGGIIGGTGPGEANIFAGCGDGSLFNNLYGVIENIDTRGVEVVNNIFECNNGLRANHLSTSNDTSFPLGAVSITSRTTNSLSGTATPNSRVDLYYSLICNYCEPQQLFASVTTDASGNWTYNGNLSNYSVVAAATINGQTSEFTSLAFTNQATDVKIKMACGGNNGAITGLTSSNTSSYQWYDANGNIVGNTLDLVNVSAGKYHLVISNGYCTNSSTVYEIKDASNQIDNSNQKISPASCNSSNGSIFGLRAASYSSLSWTDGSGTVIGKTLDLSNLKVGSYTLTLNTSDGCTQVYGPITVPNSNGPNINQSAIAIQSTSCGQTAGAIKGITATGLGTLAYSWKNAAGAEVGTAADLSNQAAGVYTLQVTDQTTCGPVYSAAINIPETNGIIMDEAAVKTTIASCGLANGTVTGIKVTSATQYQWTNASGKVVATTTDLTGAVVGSYTLTASNSYGCVKTSKVYQVSQQALTVYPQYASVITNACYSEPNGSISFTTDALIKSVRWVYNGSNFSNASAISNLAAGTYQLYLTDANGCEQLYNSYTVKTAAQLQIIQGSGTIVVDGCSLKTGSVTGVQVTGGFPPYTYSWTNSSGKIVSSAMDLTGVGADIYTISITDSRSCALVTASYEVQNQDNVIAPPFVSYVQICAPGNAIISVNNPQSGLTYKLYDSETAVGPISQQTGGRFTVNAKANSTFYVSQVSGSCESSRTAVTVSVGISATDIPNAITPNADGINDYWKIPGIENYPQAMVRIYNRNGQQVFESRGYATAFNGTYNGKLLPYGVYYYVIELSNSCNLLSGSITIVR